MCNFPKGCGAREINGQRSRSNNVPEVLHLSCEEVALAEFYGRIGGMKSPKDFFDLVKMTFDVLGEYDDTVNVDKTRLPFQW